MDPTGPEALPTAREEVARPLAQAFGLALGVLLLVFGIAGLVGRVWGPAWLGAPLDSWPPLRILSSIGLTLLGAAWLGFLRGKRRLAVLIAALTVTLSTLSLVAFVIAIRLPDTGMALASAVLLLIASQSIFAAAMRPAPGRRELSLGIAGFILLSLSATFIVARAAGVLDPLADGAVGGASIQTVVGCLLLGASFLSLVWSPGMAASARWLAPAVALAGLVTVLVLWRALSAREDQQIATLVGQAGIAERANLQQQLRVSEGTLRRTADWHAGKPPAEEQRWVVQSLKRDLPGLDTVIWLPWSAARTDSVIPRLGLPTLDTIWARYRGGAAAPPESTAYYPLDLTSRAMVVFVPGCNKERCSGTLAGIFQVAALFQGAFADTSRGFRSAVESGRTPYAGAPRPRPQEAHWTRNLALDLGNVRMNLATWPTTETLRQVRSNLPGLVLVLGLMVSGLLPLTIHLGQRARRVEREAERARLASALERATDGIWEWDLVSGIAVRSAGLWRYLGYDPETVPWERSAWSSLIHPADQARVEEGIRRHLAGESPSFEAEYRVQSQAGNWHTILDRGRVVDRSATGQPIRLLGISADVTETRSAEAAREATERRFRAIFDSGFQFQLLLDRAGVVIEVNQVALVERKAPAHLVRGRPVWETLWWAEDTEAGARLREAIQRAAATGDAPNYEEELQSTAGPVTILDIAIKPITDAEGQATQLLLEARDITARRRAEAALQEVDTLTTMGRVAARVAHEINNPLAGIQNSFLLIKGAVPPTHPHFAYVGAIEREIARIAAVTRQLYETYRPETEGNGETALRTVLGDAIAFLEQVNRSARVAVVASYENIPGVIPLPAAMLRQIAYNLIQNGIEVCPPGATVQVLARVANGDLTLRVTDAGPGVPPELRERIFEPFFSTKDARSRTSGMGLGLALVRRTVTAAGGTVFVTDGTGGGSEFVVRLPLAVRDNGA